jgi:acyl-CoA thioester hydrolase
MHTFHQRVYVEHTDYGGIVYHATYLAFAEYARSEWLRQLGFPLSSFLELGQFVVAECRVRFHKPAHLDDLLTVTTRPLIVKRSLLALEQIFHRDTVTLARLYVKLAWTRNGNLATLPSDLSRTLQG